MSRVVFGDRSNTAPAHTFNPLAPPGAKANVGREEMTESLFAALPRLTFFPVVKQRRRDRVLLFKSMAELVRRGSGRVPSERTFHITIMTAEEIRRRDAAFAAAKKAQAAGRCDAHRAHAAPQGPTAPTPSPAPESGRPDAAPPSPPAEEDAAFACRPVRNRSPAPKASPPRPRPAAPVPGAVFTGVPRSGPLPQDLQDLVDRIRELETRGAGLAGGYGALPPAARDTEGAASQANAVREPGAVVEAPHPSHVPLGRLATHKSPAPTPGPMGPDPSFMPLPVAFRTPAAQARRPPAHATAATQVTPPAAPATPPLAAAPVPATVTLRHAAAGAPAQLPLTPLSVTPAPAAAAQDARGAVGPAWLVSDSPTGASPERGAEERSWGGAPAATPASAACAGSDASVTPVPQTVAREAEPELGPTPLVTPMEAVGLECRGGGEGGAVRPMEAWDDGEAGGDGGAFDAAWDDYAGVGDGDGWGGKEHGDGGQAATESDGADKGGDFVDPNALPAMAGRKPSLSPFHTPAPRPSKKARHLWRAEVERRQSIMSFGLREEEVDGKQVRRSSRAARAPTDWWVSCDTKYGPRENKSVPTAKTTSEPVKASGSWPAPSPWVDKFKEDRRRRK